MGRRSTTGGVSAAGKARIQFTFKLEGVRYHPTLLKTPTEANLRRAREQLAGIKERIAASTFSFAEEFPEYRNLHRVPCEGSPRTCAQVFDDFLAHCEARVAKSDMAPVTLASYRRVLNGIWRPKIGPLRFLSVQYSTLVKIADEADWSKKSYNNAISVLRRAFKFGYRDHSDQHNPTRALKSARIRKKDRPIIDPFTIHEAEALIAAVARDWGEAQGNYDEFRFFTGLRPSEQIALVVSDFDAAHRTLCVTKARVAGIEKDSTKTGEDRRIVLCPRALWVVKRQLTLRAELERSGKICHDHLFFKANGEPIRNLQYPYTRWRRTFARLPSIRYRKPYCARHSSVSWDLMIGRSALWVARQHGHSIATMLRAYAAWTEGAIEADIDAIRRAMANDSTALPGPSSSTQSNTARSLTRPFDVESTPVTIRAPKPAAFASEFASSRHRPSAKCSKRLGMIWRRERDSKWISKLLTNKESTSPAIPRSPRICHQICHQEWSARLR